VNSALTGQDLTMSKWLEGLSTLQIVLLVLAVLFGISVGALVLGAVLVRLGMRRPATVEHASRLAERVLGLVKRPLTIVVLDEVAAVIQTGHYTRNISEALLENHDELKALAAEKIRQDPNVRLIGKLPGYDALVSEASETVLRVLISMLGDPRMDELVSDLLRNNLEQIKRAVRDRDHERIGPPEPPDPVPASAPRPT
jgi:hypothetical protein